MTYSTRLALFCVLASTLLSFTSFGQCNNVVTNGDASAGLTGWTFSGGTGTNWAVQNSTYGPSFKSSYNWCTMTQTIDLWAQGYTAAYLDNNQPEISYFQMYTGGWPNYADQFYYEVELLNSNNQTLDDYNLGSQSSPTICTSSWDTISGSFTNYGTGARYVKIKCGGNDAEFWSGYYGARVDNSIVSVSQVINANICSGSYPFNGQMLTSTGVYTGNFTGQFGCDSNVILNLQVGPYNISDTFDLCDGDTFNFNGQYVLTDSIVTGNFTSIAGCDSNVSYQVNFRDVYDDTITASICPGDGYNFGGQMIYTAGTYADAFTSQYGCDSVIHLTLSLSPTNFQQITDYICPSSTYQFGDTTLTTSGLYVRHFPNQYGCDSTVQLTLVNGMEYDIQEEYTICKGDSIPFGSIVITETGTYSETFATVNGGCDSIVTIKARFIDLNLGIKTSQASLSSKDTNSESTFQWLNCNNGMNPILGATNKAYVPPLGGSYAVEITNNFCVDTSNCKKFTPVGMDDVSSDLLRVFPNPAYDMITVTPPSGFDADSWQLTDMQGRIVLDQRISSETAFTIPVTEVAEGLYVLVIKSDDSELKKPVAIKH